MSEKKRQINVLLVLAQNVVAARDHCCDAEFSSGPEDYCKDCEMWSLCFAVEKLRAQIDGTKP